jgi:hypothetical protein
VKLEAFLQQSGKSKKKAEGGAPAGAPAEAKG